MLFRNLKRNWPLKLACLALAVILWLVVVGDPELVTIKGKTADRILK